MSGKIKHKRILAALLICVLIISNAYSAYSTENPSNDVFNFKNTVEIEESNVQSISACGFFKPFTSDELQYAVLSTRTGLDFISDGNVVFSIYIPQGVSMWKEIGDIDGDGFNDILAVPDNKYLPSLQAYSGKDGHQLWFKTPTMEVYKKEEGIFDLKTDIQCIKEIDSIAEDRGKYILVISGYKVMLLDKATGECIWEYTDVDNVWDAALIDDINNNGSRDVAFGNQKGMVSVIDGSNGKLTWNRKLVPDFISYNDNGTVKYRISRSVWSVVPIKDEGKDKLIVSGEDGKVYFLDPSNGSNLNKELDLCEISDSAFEQCYDSATAKYSSGVYDGNYFNIKLELVDDTLIAAINTFNNGRYTRRIEGSQPSLAIIDYKNYSVRYETSDFNIAEKASWIIYNYNGENTIIFPELNDKGNISLKIFSLENCSLLQVLKYEVLPQLKIIDVISIAANDKNELLIATPKGVYLINPGNGEVIWNIGAGLVAKYLNTQAGLLLMYGRFLITEYSGNLFEKLVLKDAATLETRWEYSIPKEDIDNGRIIKYVSESSGYIAVLLTSSVASKDSKPDEVVCIDANSGSIVFSVLLPNGEKVKNIEVYNGQIIVISSLGVYVYNASDGTLFSEITQREIAQKDNPVLKFSDISVLNYFDISQYNILSIHDCNNDGICDFVFIGKSDIYVAESYREGNKPVYYMRRIGNIGSYSAGTEYIPSSASVIPDSAKGDYCPLFVEQKSSEGTSKFILFSLKDGRMLYQTEGVEVAWDCPGVDFNNNGAYDIIIHEGELNFRADLIVIDGNDGSLIWKFDPIYKKDVKLATSVYHTRIEEQKNIKIAKYAAPVKDITEDGIAELAVYRSFLADMGSTYIQIDVFDINKNSNIPLKTLGFGKKERYFNDVNYTPGGVIKEIHMPDEKKAFILARSSIQLIDADTGDVLVSYSDNLDDMEIIPESNKLIYNSISYNSTFVMDLGTTIKYHNIADGMEVKAPFELSWTPDSSGSDVEIYVNGSIAARTNSNSILLNLEAGSNKITVKRANVFGKVENATVNIKVVKSPLINYAISFLALVSIALLLSPMAFEIIESRELKRIQRSNDNTVI